MSKKSAACYESVFRYIRDNIFDCQGVSFTTDYEKAMRKSLRKVFPSHNLYACWFHYTQAIKRRCEMDSELKLLISTNERANIVYHQLLCLPLLPPQYIEQAYHLVVMELNLLNESDRQKFDEFLKYFKEQWLVRVSVFCKSGVYLVHVSLTYNVQVCNTGVYQGHFYLKFT